MVQQRPDKIQILFPAGDELRHGEVMNFQAKSGATTGIFVAD